MPSRLYTTSKVAILTAPIGASHDRPFDKVFSLTIYPCIVNVNASSGTRLNVQSIAACIGL